MVKILKLKMRSIFAIYMEDRGKTCVPRTEQSLFVYKMCSAKQQYKGLKLKVV